MRPEDFLLLLRARPFVPFRVYMSNGTEYDVRHPEFALVGRSTVVIGIPGPRGPEGPATRLLNCSLVHIVRTEPLDGPMAAT